MTGVRERILIINDGADCGSPYTPLFSSVGEVTLDKAAFKLNPYAFKLLVFTGGSDVSPGMYGDTSPHRVCHYDTGRDIEEADLYKFGQQRGVHMVGICRGMQFLNVMGGGKMVHDLQGHNSSHMIMTKDCDEPFLVNSFHHQMCVPHKKAQILAWSHEKQSKQYIGDEDEPIDYRGPEVEAIYTPWLKILGVQWHPEVMMASSDNTKGRGWFLVMLRDFLKVDTITFEKLYLGMSGAQINVTEV